MEERIDLVLPTLRHSCGFRVQLAGAAKNRSNDVRVLLSHTLTDVSSHSDN